MTPPWADWHDRIAWSLVAGGVIGLCGWLTWLTAGVVGTVDAAEVQEQIRTQSPYTEDRKLILQHMQDRRAAEDRLAAAIERQNESIRRMEQELAGVRALLRQQLTMDQ